MKSILHDWLMAAIGLAILLGIMLCVYHAGAIQ